jgi:CPA1 family monovalent cation:H+ antiporter
MPLPARVTHIVNAESLLNDATGLVAFKLAVAAAVAAGTTSMDLVTGQFVILSGGGMAIGIVIEWLGRKFRERLIRLGKDDPVVQTLLTVLVPYAAYLVAEGLHVSGILAVVASGLWAGGQEVKGLSPESRRHAREVWRMIAWIFNGLVFVLLGLQLRWMLAGVAAYDGAHLVLWAFALWAVLMAVRIAWVWGSGYARYHFGWGWAGGSEGPDPRRMFLVGWAAVRGSITLATALSVPLVTHAGDAFPQRDLVVFLAASTIILTLVLNGLTLPFIIPRLHAKDDPEGPVEEANARKELAKAAIAALQPAIASIDNEEDRRFASALLARYEGKVALREGSPEAAAMRAERITAARRLRLEGIAAERARLDELLGSGQINDETALAIEEELDERELVTSADPDKG